MNTIYWKKQFTVFPPVCIEVTSLIYYSDHLSEMACWSILYLFCHAFIYIFFSLPHILSYQSRLSSTYSLPRTKLDSVVRPTFDISASNRSSKVNQDQDEIDPLCTTFSIFFSNSFLIWPKFPLCWYLSWCFNGNIPPTTYKLCLNSKQLL